MQIFVKCQSGKTITVNVGPTHKILDIMYMIKEQQGYPVDMQHLTSHGKALMSHLTV